MEDAARQRQQTEEFKSAYVLRSPIERKQSELVQHGLRETRYLGHPKRQLQRLWQAAVVNLSRLSRLCASGKKDLNALLETAYSTIKRRSLVFIVSDFFSKPGWERPLALLNRRHEVIAVRLSDPREMDLPDIGLIVMEDAETGEQIYVDTHDKRFRDRFQAGTQRREVELNAAFRRGQIDVLSLSTEEDLLRSIVRFAVLRKQRKFVK